METNNYPVGLLGGHPELLHCVGEKELQRKKSLIQTTLEEEEISGSLETDVLPQCTVFRVILNGTAERTQIGQLKGTLSEATGRSVRILQEDNTVRIEVLNDEPSGVPLRALLQSPQFRRCSSSLPLPLGLGTDFRPEVLDLDAVVDIVMTGQNNAELSTMMNVFIASLLYAVPRDNVRMVLMDLNGDGLSLWKGVSGVEYVYGDELSEAIKSEIRHKKSDMVGDMSSQGTTPRQLTDLLGSLADLTSGSGDKGTPVVWIKNYFKNYSD